MENTAHSMAGILNLLDVLALEKWDRNPRYVTGFDPCEVFGVRQTSIPVFDESYSTRRMCRGEGLKWNFSKAA